MKPIIDNEQMLAINEQILLICGDVKFSLILNDSDGKIQATSNISHEYQMTLYQHLLDTASQSVAIPTTRRN